MSGKLFRIKAGRGCLAACAAVVGAAPPASSSRQRDRQTANGAGPYGDGNTRYSPLDQINANNVKNLKVAWAWKGDNFGSGPEIKNENTPLMVNGVLYFTAGDRRAVVAADAGTGETLWTYRYEEPTTRTTGARKNSRGVSYWTDGRQRQDPHRHAGLQPDRARREKRSSRCRLRRRRHCRPHQAGRKGRELRSDRRPPDEHLAARDLRQRRRHSDRARKRAQSEIDEVPERRT